MLIQASYLNTALTVPHVRKLIAYLVPILQEQDKITPFDTIAFRGLSGALLGPMLAVQLDKGMLAVRKEDNSHSRYQVEGLIKDNNRYVIVDDLVCMGGTIKEIVEKISLTHRNKFLHPAVFVGLTLYKSTQEEIVRLLGHWEQRVHLAEIPRPKFGLGVTHELYDC